MGVYIVRRVFQTTIVLVLLSILIFVMLYSSGDPAALLAPSDATLKEIEQVRAEYGLDRPLVMQYFAFFKQIFTGKLESFYLHTSVMPVIVNHFLRSLELTGLSLAIAFLLALPIGTFAATQLGTIYDHFALLIALLGQSMPVFWLGMLLIQVFSVNLGLLPVSGWGPIRHWILPVTTLAAYNLGIFTRMTRSAMLETLNKDYVRTARAKGLSENVVLSKHVLKNSLVGIITLLGIQLSAVLGGVILVEVVFSWPGIGRLLYNAVLNRDFPIVLSGALFMGIGVGIINLSVDLLYGFLDPRIRIEEM